MNRREFVLVAGGAVLRASLPADAARAAPVTTTDVCVYGGTASGVMAAVAATREGAKVLVVEPSRWLGGMTGGGLIHIDWGRGEAFGDNVRTILKDGTSDAAYRRRFADMLGAAGVSVVREHRVASVRREGTAIRSITLDHAPPDRFGCPAAIAKVAEALTVTARVFIDCSYEGDLMARSGVSYTFGRESAEQYGESLAGVRPNLAVYPIDPYVKPGEPKSGLLPLLQDYRMGTFGSADRQTMGYGFRWKFSTALERLPIEAPDDYDPRTFEVYRRGFKAGVNMAKGRRMRSLGKYEPEGGHIYAMGAGNLARALWAPTVYGANADYPDGDYATRARIWKFHQNFLRGITHFLRTDPAAPAEQREKALGIGFAPGPFDDTGGWPHQMYVREARRMRSSYVVTQKDLEGRTDPDDPVGLASYGVDDWPYATFPHEGGIALQGGEFSILYLTDRHRGIYKIPYRAIAPKRAECGNLLVPVCCSASHIAMTSLRMEPVWMTLGQSAGLAAAMAVKENLAVQDVDYGRLRTRLLDLRIKLQPPA
jgi:hypothetical protein